MGLAELVFDRPFRRFAKAETGSYVGNMTYNAPLGMLNRTPQAKAAQAQELYRGNPWVRKAENVVSGKVSGLPWHLEDANEEEIDDDVASGSARVAMDLLLSPQAALDPEMRQPGIQTYHDLIRVTSRTLGPGGTAFWYKDGVTGLGIPNALLIINPTRMFPAYAKNGRNILGWALDKPADQGGTPLTLDEVVPFYLDPPDEGAFGFGLAEVVFAKAQLGYLADRHASTTLRAGGRLTGIISPKDQNTMWSDDQWAQLVRDYRNVTEDDDSAKRLQIVKGPIEYVRTAATMAELAVLDIANMSRDDILAVWGVPLSQAAIQIKAGLNSGETKGFDEAVLMQGAVHDRVTPITETIQAAILDLFPDTLTYVIEEPSFDDELPQYTIAQTAQNQPLTRNERREIMGKDPLPDWDDITGEPLGTAIDLPATLVTVGSAPSDEQRPNIAPPPTPPPAVVPIPGIAQVPAGSRPPGDTSLPPDSVGKAARTFLGLRSSVDRRYVPATKRSVLAVLRSQAQEVAAAIRAHAAHVASKPKDDSVYWNHERERKRMLDAIRPHAAALSETVTGRMTELVPHRAPGKAEAWEVRVEQRVIDKVASRVKDITDTTRQAIRDAVAAGIASGQTPLEVADAIEAAATFDDYRAEMIALTEMGKTYNEAALGSYSEFGITEVEAVDGDQDEECAARDGQTFSLDDADAETADEHPNGTLDWVPVIDTALAAARLDPPVAPQDDPTDRLVAALAQLRFPAPIVNVTVPEPRVFVSPPTTKKIVRDQRGQVIGIKEE